VGDDDLPVQDAVCVVGQFGQVFGFKASGQHIGQRRRLFHRQRIGVRTRVCDDLAESIDEHQGAQWVAEVAVDAVQVVQAGVNGQHTHQSLATVHRDHHRHQQALVFAAEIGGCPLLFAVRVHLGAAQPPDRILVNVWPKPDGR